MLEVIEDYMSRAVGSFGIDLGGLTTPVIKGGVEESTILYRMKVGLTHPPKNQ